MTATAIEARVADKAHTERDKVLIRAIEKIGPCTYALHSETYFRYASMLFYMWRSTGDPIPAMRPTEHLLIRGMKDQTKLMRQQPCRLCSVCQGDDNHPLGRFIHDNDKTILDYIGREVRVSDDRPRWLSEWTQRVKENKSFIG